MQTRQQMKMQEELKHIADYDKYDSVETAMHILRAYL